MKERPILFSGPMVRAILEGRKTQTRRMVKPQPVHGLIGKASPPKSVYCPDGGRVEWYDSNGVNPGVLVTCPYGKPGDRLWVKETHCRFRHQASVPVHYMADGPMPTMEQRHDAGLLKQHPSIYMPRWASRITLEIVQVRVERLHDITEADAIAEGIRHELTGPSGRDYYDCGTVDKRTGMPICLLHTEARTAFFHLWTSINGAESFAANPWVWVLEFKRVTERATTEHTENTEGRKESV